MKAIIWVSIYVLSAACQQLHAQNPTKAEKFTSVEVLSKLKRLRDAMKNSLEEVDDFMRTDAYLLRWLKGANMDVDNSKEKLEKAIKWKAENNVKNVLTERPIKELFHMPFFKTDGVDKKGHPVQIFEIKKLDLRKFALSGNTSTIQRVFLQMYEHMEHEIYKTSISTGEAISQGILIADQSGYNLRQHACIPCFSFYSFLTRIYEDLYPGMYNKIIVINAPRIFLPLLQLVKPLMSPQTRDVLDVYGPAKEEWQPKLLQLISADQLPEKYGGTRKTI